MAGERQRNDRRPVVAGVDGSNGARVAALWAAAEAALRGVELHLVHSSPPNASTAVDVPSPRGTAGPAAQQLLHDVRRACEHASPALVVRTHLELIPAAPALVRWSDQAQLVVVGHHGVSRFTGLMVGSVCAALGERARCPVVVVRTDDAAVPAHSGPIVLGLTGAGGDENVIDFAFAAAERTRCPLIAVRNWWTELDEDFLGELFEFSSEVDRQLARIKDEVSRTVARAQREHPTIAMTIRVVHDRPAPTLLDEAERNQPQLLVLAAHDRDVPRRFLGTTARTLLHHADCPVAIVAPASQPSTATTLRAPTSGHTAP
jgi:nucleotide-binding universal stress UspA family protein